MSLTLCRKSNKPFKCSGGRVLQQISRIVTSNQTGIHDGLEALVKKHLTHQYLKPYQAHNLSAFDTLTGRVTGNYFSGMLLDSCCGTAMSSIHLATQNPDKLVVGVDQSYHRLNKEGLEASIPHNCILLRANCEDLWRLCIENNITFEKHYILYPNPWPKSKHLLRRWHGHPVFPAIKQLAPATEVRSNWKVYLEEFAIAWQIVSGKLFEVKVLAEKNKTIEKPMTLFEKKYGASGQTLYQLMVSS